MSQQEIDNYKDKIEGLRKNITKVEEHNKDELKSLEKREDSAKKMQQDYSNKIKAGAKDVALGKNLVDNTKEKIDSNKSEMHKLKKEHKDLEKQHEKMSKKYKKISMNTEKLRQGNIDEKEKFDELGPDANDLVGQSNDLKKEEKKSSKQNKKLNSDVANWQNNYWKVASQRLEAQNTMKRILTLIHRECDDQNILQQTNIITQQVERKMKQIMDDVDADYGNEKEKIVDPKKYPLLHI